MPDRMREEALESDAGERLKALVDERVIPITVMFEVTLRCNIRCRHCYNFDRDEPRPAVEELTPAEIHGLLEQVRAEGALFVSFTGGEALVHPNLFDFLEHAGRLHMATRVLSNGTTLTPAVVARLASYDHLQGVDVSLYGARAETHDAFTQSRGSFERTWRGSRALRDRGVRVRLKYVLLRANAEETGEMMRRARDEGFHFSLDAHITERYDGSKTSLATRATAEQLEALYAGPLREMLEKETDLGRFPQALRCNCARNRAAITAGGDVYPCMAAPISGGNVRTRTFADIWRRSPVFHRIRGLKEEDFATCHPCPLRTWCQREAGQSYMASGEYTGIDPWFCEEAKVVQGVLGPREGAR